MQVPLKELLLWKRKRTLELQSERNYSTIQEVRNKMRRFMLNITSLCVQFPKVFSGSESGLCAGPWSSSTPTRTHHVFIQFRGFVHRCIVTLGKCLSLLVPAKECYMQRKTLETTVCVRVWGRHVGVLVRCSQTFGHIV